jgi:hypothetical protein
VRVMTAKFFVRREGCWGGTFLWFVADCGTRRNVSKPQRSEKAAHNLRQRMEADWKRYSEAMLARVPRETT